MENRPKILIVDDEKMNLKLMASMLAPLQHEVLLANNGEDALNIVARENPDLILLDVMMPRLDGFTVCRMLKSDEATRLIPIIMVTALNQLEDRVQGLEAGADDFLTKPFHELELTTRVRSLLRVKQLNDQLHYAHKHINYITRHVEGLLGSFDPLSFKLETVNQELWQQLLGLKERAPEAVLTAAADAPVNWRGCFYRRQGGSIRAEAVAFSWPAGSPGAEVILAAREGVFANREDGKEEAVADFLVSRMPAGTGPWRNYAAYYNYPLLIAAFNYPCRVTAYELDVLRNFLTYSQFVQLVAGQIKSTEEAFHYTIKALARAAEVNDDDTGNHITRVGIFARELAQNLGCADYFCREIALAAQMHDVGKVHIHPDVLRKPGRLNAVEWRLMHQHPLYGTRILGDAPRLQMAREVALHHHEKWDGSGYPAGLKGEDISLAGRIVALADVYDALRNKRSYKPAFSHREACGIITAGDGRVLPGHFDPEVLMTFQRIAPRFADIYETLRD